MSYRPGQVSGAQLKSGAFALATMDAKGNWIKAATASFVQGPWNPGYKLGTYGVDEATSTVWAVIDYNGKFAVANHL
jgi:hypothetical protein